MQMENVVLFTTVANFNFNMLREHIDGLTKQKMGAIVQQFAYSGHESPDAILRLEPSMIDKVNLHLRVLNLSRLLHDKVRGMGEDNTSNRPYLWKDDCWHCVSIQMTLISFLMLSRFLILLSFLTCFTFFICNYFFSSKIA